MGGDDPRPGMITASVTLMGGMALTQFPGQPGQSGAALGLSPEGSIRVSQGDGNSADIRLTAGLDMLHLGGSGSSFSLAPMGGLQFDWPSGIRLSFAAGFSSPTGGDNTAGPQARLGLGYFFNRHIGVGALVGYTGGARHVTPGHVVPGSSYESINGHTYTTDGFRTQDRVDQGGTLLTGLSLTLQI